MRNHDLANEGKFFGSVDSGGAQTMNTSVPTPTSSPINELFENDRLWRKFYGDEPRDLFRRALRAYGDCTSSDRYPWLVEAVIRTARGVADDPGPLHSEEQTILRIIKDHYRIFAHVDTIPDPVTFASSHAMLRSLFFR